MRLSVYSDYSIRVLMYAAFRMPQRVKVAEVAEAYGISRNHLVKVVHDLGLTGYLTTYRGIGGGFSLSRPPEEMVLGEIIRLGEKSEKIIECRDRKDGPCRILSACLLKEVLDEAAEVFFEVLDRYTLADLLKNPAKMQGALGIKSHESY